MIDPLARRPVGPDLVRALLVLLILLVAPHLRNLSLWILGLFSLLVIYRLFAIHRPRLMPNQWTLLFLMLVGLANVAWAAGLSDARHTGTALLIIMLGLKLLELRTRRDLYVCIFLGFFVIMTQFLYAQDLWLAAYSLALSSLLVGLLLALNRVHFELPSLLGDSAVLITAALPMAAALFLFFPRLDSPLWAIHQENPTAVTGISNQMTMGNVGQLSQSSKIAFRVTFSGKTPGPQQRYWRALVLWDFDGRTWHPSHSPLPANKLEVDPRSKVDYRITYEPSGQPWLFALDMPDPEDHQVWMNDDYQLVADNPIDERQELNLSSYTKYSAKDLSNEQSQLGLSLPPKVSKRTRQLVANWQRQAGAANHAAIIEMALRYFNQQPFVYSLQPGVMHDDVIDEFLFEQRKGFCEHYAGSFAVLMRLAGIPTRVVLGYQGGEFNPRAGHWVIRQSDAHAWNEVWLPDLGWVRVDPTAAVAPERIEHSLDLDASSNSNAVVFQINTHGFIKSLWQEVGWLSDSMEIGWHRWILGFSKRRQESLLDGLGFGKAGGWQHTLILFALLVVGSAFAYLLLLFKKRLRPNPGAALWLALRQQLGRNGLIVPAWFGPNQLMQVAIQHWPDARHDLESLFNAYTAWRYGSHPTKKSLAQLHQRIRRLKLKRVR